MSAPIKVIRDRDRTDRSRWLVLSCTPLKLAVSHTDRGRLPGWHIYGFTAWDAAAYCAFEAAEGKWPA